MRDPYEILGVARGASLEEIRAAYRRACKSRHPDLGGSHEAMVELNAAYEFVLNELKHGRQRTRGDEEASDAGSYGKSGAGAREPPRDEPRHANDPDIDRDIDEELEALRRASEQYEERMRARRREAWQTGRPDQWAQLAWSDVSGFLLRIAQSGAKGVALLVAALMGLGSFLIELNVVSALIVLGSLIGVAVSVALKNDKGGLMSAALMLFGLMTIVLTPVRDAALAAPLTTLGALLCLALIFKFAREGGRAGLMTGGVLTAYVLIVIVSRAPPHPPERPPSVAYPESRPLPVAPTPNHSPAVRPTPTPTFAERETPRPIASPPATRAQLEERTLSASDGATLKFVSGVVYRLRVRSGRATSLIAVKGAIRPRSSTDESVCAQSLDFASEAGATPWRDVDEAYVACGADAVMRATSPP